MNFLSPQSSHRPALLWVASWFPRQSVLPSCLPQESAMKLTFELESLKALTGQHGNEAFHTLCIRVFRLKKTSVKVHVLLVVTYCFEPRVPPGLYRLRGHAGIFNTVVPEVLDESVFKRQRKQQHTISTVCRPMIM